MTNPYAEIDPVKDKNPYAEIDPDANPYAEIDPVEQRLDEEQPEGSAGFFGGVSELGRGIARGAAVRVPEMIGKSMQFFDPEGGSEWLSEAGRSLVESAEKRLDEYDWMKETRVGETARERDAMSIRGGAGQAGEMFAPSMSMPLAGAIAGTFIAGPVGTFVGGIIGTVLSLPMYFGSQAQETYEKGYESLNKQYVDSGMDPEEASERAHDEAVVAGIKTGTIEAGGEFVANLIPLSLLKFVPRNIRSGLIRSVTKGLRGPVPMIKDLTKVIAGEVGTELAQVAGQQAVEAGIGVGEDPTWDSIKGVIVPTVIMSLLTFGGAESVGGMSRSRVRKLLEDPAANPEDRIEAIKNVAQAIKKQDPELADLWLKSAISQLEKEEPIIAQDDEFYREQDATVEQAKDIAQEEFTEAEPPPYPEDLAADQAVEPPVAPELQPGERGQVAPEAELVAPIRPPEPTPTEKPRKIPTGKWNKPAEPVTDDLIMATAKLGGISRKEAISQGIDPAEFKVRRGRPLFPAQGGKTMDAVAKKLAELGYPVTDERGNYSANVMLDSLTSALGGKSVYSSRVNPDILAEQQGFFEAADRAKIEAGKVEAAAKIEEKKKSDQEIVESYIANKYGRPATQEEVEAIGEEMKSPDNLVERAARLVDIVEQHMKRGMGIVGPETLKKEMSDLSALIDEMLPTPKKAVKKTKKTKAEKKVKKVKVVKKPAETVEEAAAQAATSPENNIPEPTEAQKEEGNYKKGHVSINGLDIAIENPRGSRRRPEWPKLTHHYGYIKRTEGKDGDQVDVFVGPDADNANLKVYVVDQINPKTGKFDEHKVMLGFKSEEAALKGYNSNYTKGWKGAKNITGVNLDSFKEWLEKGDTKKQFAEKGPRKPKYTKEQIKLEEIATRYEAIGKKKDAERIRKASFKEKVDVAEFESAITEAEKQAEAKLEGKPVKEEPAKEPDIFDTPPDYSSQTVATGKEKGIPVEAAQKVVDKFLADYNGPEIKVIVVKDQSVFKKKPTDNIKGGFYADTNTVVLVADNLESNRDAYSTLRHEILAHYGLGLFDAKTRNNILDAIHKSRNGILLNKTYREVRKDYKDLSDRKMAEEVFANIAQEQPTKATEVWDKIVEMVMQALRKIGLLKGYVAKSELRNLVASIGEGIRKGKKLRSKGEGVAFAKKKDEFTVEYTGAPVKFASKETEARYQEARKGLADQRTMIERVGTFITHTWHGFSRRHIDLPNEAKFALANEALRQYEAAPQAAKEEAINHLKNITKGMSRAEYDLFTRKVILDDLAYEAELGHDIPFGFTIESLAKDKNIVDAAVEESSILKKSLKYRKTLQDSIRDDLVKSKILSKEDASNPAYFRHQVLTYARARQLSQGVGGKIKKPKPGYAMKRHGSVEDINANYLEAEFEFLHRAMIDIKAVETIDKISNDYDISSGLKEKAKAESKKTGKKVDWRDLLPEGYQLWQPDKGNLFYTGISVPEQAINKLLDSLVQEDIFSGDTSLNAINGVLESMKKTIMLGGKKHEMAIPEELAATMDNMRQDVDDGLFDHMLSTPLKWWKQWVLINPRRVLKYNINNMSGDLDATLAGAPKVLLKLPQAIKELYAVMKDGNPSDLYLEAVSRGVFDAGLTVQEIPDIQLLDPFQDIVDKPKLAEHPVNFAKSKFYSIWKVLRDYTRFRENWLRYAAYIHYVEKIESGETMESIGYGASNPKMVDELFSNDPRDAAALLARDLIGDYGNVSHFGKGIRKRVIPFYSWIEVNTGRYLRLTANAYSQGIGKGIATTGFIGASIGARTTAWLGIRMFILYSLVQLWNNLFFSDEEDELSSTDRVRLHLNLGKGSDGRIRTIKFQGALSDFLQWFGAEDAIASFLEIEKGRANWGDVAVAVGKAPINKIVGGLSPVIKTPLELTTGLSFYPDVFNPRSMKDKYNATARLFSLDNEYNWLVGKPTRGYLRSLEGAVIYSRDAGELSYNKIRGLARKHNRRTKGIDGFSTYTSPRSVALYEWRLARRFGDKKAEARARINMRKLGMRGKDRIRTRKNAHPLGSISKKDRRSFIKTLSPREKESLRKAVLWYKKIYFGRRK